MLQTPKKRGAEDEIQELRNKIRKLEQEQQKKSAAKVYVNGEYKNKVCGPLFGRSDSEEGLDERPMNQCITTPSANQDQSDGPDSLSPETPEIPTEANRDIMTTVRPQTSVTTSQANDIRTNPGTLQANEPRVNTPNNVLHYQRNELLNNSINRLISIPNTLQANKTNGYLHNHRIIEDPSNNPRDEPCTTPEANQSRVLNRTVPSNSLINNPSTNRTPQSVPHRAIKLQSALKNALSLYGENIDPTLAKQWNPILRKGLLENVNNALQRKYAVPGNCKLLKAPSLNEEILPAVDRRARTRDHFLQKTQEQTGLALTALGRGMTLLLNHGEKYAVHAIEKLKEASFLLADLHFKQTSTRRILCGDEDSNIKKFMVRKI